MRIGPISIGDGARIALIAGPCALESEGHAVALARDVIAIAERHGFPLIFKASYEKANRTSRLGYRGVGVSSGLEILRKVRALGVPVLTDVHDVAQVGLVAPHVDCVQIPAFLSRQTELLEEAGRLAKAVNIKKGQFLSPLDMRHAIDKVDPEGTRSVMVTERGTMFGYNNLVVDFRSIPIMRAFGRPVVFDATHSVQLPSAAGGFSGGERQFVPALARAAAAVGIDALFVEVHEIPSRSPSDGTTVLDLDGLEDVLSQVAQLDRVARDNDIRSREG